MKKIFFLLAFAVTIFLFTSGKQYHCRPTEFCLLKETETGDTMKVPAHNFRTKLINMPFEAIQVKKYDGRIEWKQSTKKALLQGPLPVEFVLQRKNVSLVGWSH